VRQGRDLILGNPTTQPDSSMSLGVTARAINSQVPDSALGGLVHAIPIIYFRYERANQKTDLSIGVMHRENGSSILDIMKDSNSSPMAGRFTVTPPG
jgi:hypothetical protein